MVKGKKKTPWLEKMGSNLSKSPSDLYDFLVDYYKKKHPIEQLLKGEEAFAHIFQSFEEFIDQYRKNITKQTLISSFFAWIKSIKITRSDLLESYPQDFLKVLIQEDLIPFELNGRLITLEEISGQDLTLSIEKIRCHLSLPLAVKEIVIQIYLDFLKWLTFSTFGYIPKIEDPDLAKTTGRVISHTQFIQLLGKLDQKGQLVAKLLYFGGSRTLEEILSLNLEDVNFKQSLIRYGTQLVSYPAHVFADIKALTEPRRTGRIFLGRQNAPLNRVTIFRSFKEAGSVSGLGTDFSPKGLTNSS